MPHNEEHMTVEIEGVALHLAHSDELSIQCGARRIDATVARRLMVVNEQDLP
jgi:hypothetical protein